MSDGYKKLNDWANKLEAFLSDDGCGISETIKDKLRARVKSHKNKSYEIFKGFGPNGGAFRSVKNIVLDDEPYGLTDGKPDIVLELNEFDWKANNELNEKYIIEEFEDLYEDISGVFASIKHEQDPDGYITLTQEINADILKDFDKIISSLRYFFYTKKFDEFRMHKIDMNAVNNIKEQISVFNNVYEINVANKELIDLHIKFLEAKNAYLEKKIETIEGKKS